VASPITLRLDPELRRRIDRIARRKKTSTSQALREAITTWVQREDSGLTPYELAADLIGSVRGGDPARSTRNLSEVLKARRRK
jgi:predicted DNA-binding protein